jgi:catechol 2,3-dioxygenase-like lactoylglutathione lyase family enzyme
MALSHVGIVSVPVSDPDRAKAFYVEVLGFEVLADSQITDDQRWVQVGLPGAQTSLTLVTWFPTMPAGSMKGLVIETDDLEADIALITEAGVPVSPIDEEPWGRFVTLADPDGNSIVVQDSVGGP